MARDALLGVEVVFRLRDELSAPAGKVSQKTQEMGKSFATSDLSLRRVANSLGIVGLGLGQVGALLEKSNDSAAKSVGTLLSYAGAAISGIGAVVQFAYAIKTLSDAFRKLAVAEAIAQAFKGPAGWAMLAGGLAIGAGAALAIEKLATGGIVSKPTMALIGESGPEAVVPLGRGGAGMGTTVVINAGAFVGDERQAREFAIFLNNHLRQLGRVGI